MSKWMLFSPTVFDIMSEAGREDEREIARQLWKQGIDSAKEWQYYYDCFMWPQMCQEENIHSRKKYKYAVLGDSFVISNGRSLIKIKGQFKNYHEAEAAVEDSQTSQILVLWHDVEERCKSAIVKQLTSKDGAAIKDLMARHWEWHIRFIFEYLGHDLEPKEEPNYFEEGNEYGARVKVASPRETAQYFKKEFFTEEHKRKQKFAVGGEHFSIMSVWLALKLIGAETAQKRNISVYKYKWDDGSVQSYLKITADGNECYLCNPKCK